MSSPKKRKVEKPKKKPTVGANIDPSTISADRLRRFTHFKRLNLPRSCSVEEVQKAYRSLALLFHPDKNRQNADADALFALVKESRDVLSDATLRAKYETELEMSDFASGFGGASSCNPYGATLGQTKVMQDLVSAHLKTGGSSMWGAARRDAASAKAKVAATVKTLVLTLEAMDDGVKVNHKYKRTRSISIGRDIERVEEVVVHVPPGSMDGDRIVVRGAGHEYYGHEAGDLIFVLSQKEHAVYTQRRGADLHITKTIGPFEMLTGCDLDVPLVNGRKALLKCKPPLRHGLRIRFHGLGMRIKERA